MDRGPSNGGFVERRGLPVRRVSRLAEQQLVYDEFDAAT
jgi:hypothetical protein